MRKILLLIFTVLTVFSALSQDFSNKGKDFYLCFPNHVPSGSNFAKLSIWITSDKASSGTITMANGAFSSTFNIAANGIAEIAVPYNAAHISTGESSTDVNTIILKKSIRVKVDIGKPPVVAYVQQFAAARSAASLLLPVNVLGKKYFAVSFAHDGTGGGLSQFQVVATKDNTVIEITPVKNGFKSPKFTVNLPLAGDMIQYQANGSGASSQDITGTLIESVASGSGGCLPIAVFSGSSNMRIGSKTPSCLTNSYDPLFQQLYPVSTWGKNFGFVPFANYPRGVPYRVLASEDNTNIYIDGALSATLNAGEIYPSGFSSQPATFVSPLSITANKPICVAEYAQSSGCSGNTPVSNQGDPDMVILNPIEQNISDITIFSTKQEFIRTQWINVVMKTIATGSFKISRNGCALAAPTSSWQPFAALPGFSYLREPLPLPGSGTCTLPGSISDSYRLVADSGFNAIAYGLGDNETYAYSAGTNVKDLYQQIQVQTEYGIETTPSVCTNSPFRFKVSLPYCADSIRWDLSNLPGPPIPSIITGNYSTCVPGPGGPDSITLVNTVPIYWYSLPTLYSFGTIGTFPVSIIAYAPNSSGCGSEQLIDFDLNISDPPTASFSKNSPGCYLEPVVVTETTSQIPKTTYKLWWEFFDPVTNVKTVYSGIGNAFRQITHSFTTPGIKQIRYSSVTTPGCLSDTLTQTIDLPKVADGSIAGNTIVCANTANPNVTFTFIDGRAPYRFSYTINGVAQVPIVSATGTYTISVPTTAPGTFIYELTEVRNDGSSLCVRPISGQTATVVVRPLPNAAIGGAKTVCLNSMPEPVVTFTGSNATAPYTFAYNINGVPQTPVVSNGAGVATVNAPTNVVGPFIYEITQITEASSTTCSKNITGTTTLITVQDLPNAAIASSTTAVCQNAAQPTITFTGSNGTAPYTFNYTINGIAQPPVVSNGVGVATLNVPTTTVGPFVYEITQVSEASGQTCLRAITGQTITLNVNPLPNAAIGGATTVCLNSAPAPVVTFTGSNSTAPYTFNYTINGVAQAPVVSDALGIATVNAPTNAVGTFIYAITQITDASSTACSRPITGTSTTIVIQDLPNGVISSSTTAACLNSAPAPTITFTGNTGTAPYTFTYTINSVTQPTVVSNAAGVATINVPTNVATTYTYELTGVSEASAQLCARTIAGQTRVVVINPLPTASIAGATAVCKDAPQPVITFTGTGATAPYTFQYTINTIAQPALISDLAGVATINAPTNVAGTFTYQLTSVSDGSSTTCSQAQSGSTVVTIYPLPTPNFNYTTPSCDTRTITFTDVSAANVGSINSWSWNFGDPASGASNTSTGTGTPTHVFTGPGTYTVSLTVGTTNGCSIATPFTRSVTINHRPKAGFISPDVCINDVATFFTDTSKITVGGFDPAGYEWDFGDGSPKTFTKDGTHLYAAPNTYMVTHIVTSTFGCKDTIIQPIVISSADPVSNFTVNNSCSSDSVELTNLSTVGYGNVTRLEVYWDNVGAPATFQTINAPAFNGVYRHKYPTLQTTKTYNIRVVAYSGVICFNQKITPVTVYATPIAQFNAIPDLCLLRAPYQITQGSEIGGVPGTGTYSGIGITNPTGTFDPQVAGIGTFAIKYTFTASNPGACIDTLTRFVTVLDTAHAAFTFVAPSCEQVATSFTDISTAPASVVPSTTVWNFGDGTGSQTFAAGATFGHVFALPNTYTVTMHTVSAYGCLSTDTSALVTIDANHHIALTSGNSNQNVCVNRPIANITYTISGGATNVSIPALPAGLSYNVAGQTLTISGAPTSAAGSPYNFTIQTTGNTCLQDQASVTITVQPDHTLALTSGNDMQSVCVNSAIDDITYDLGGGANSATVSGLPAGVTYTINGTILTIKGTPSTTVGTPFAFSIQTSGNACVQASATGEIKVNPYPVPSFTFDNTSYCIPNALVGFNNTTTPAPTNLYTYLWKFDEPSSGANDSSKLVNPSHLYSSAGPFNVTLTATSTVVLNNNVIGCAASKTSLLNFIHPQPKADFVFNKQAVCIGDNVTITDNTDGKDGIVNKWFWNLGDGTSATNNPVTHTYPDTATYIITMYSVNSFGCHSDTINKLPVTNPYKPFTVYPYPYINIGPDRSLLEGGQITLEPSVYARQPQYLWTPSQYLNQNNVRNPTVVKPLTDMTYTLTVTGQGGCALSKSVFVKLLRFPTIPNTFTPNHDGINDEWRIDFLNTYPDNRVQIFTRSGQLVFESKGYNKPWDGTVKGKPLPFDTYYYIIEPGSGRDPITGYVTIIK